MFYLLTYHLILYHLLATNHINVTLVEYNRKQVKTTYNIYITIVWHIQK